MSSTGSGKDFELPAGLRDVSFLALAITDFLVLFDVVVLILDEVRDRLDGG